MAVAPKSVFVTRPSSGSRIDDIRASWSARESAPRTDKIGMAKGVAMLGHRGEGGCAGRI